jgi:hypothetical protein
MPIGVLYAKYFDLIGNKHMSFLKKVQIAAEPQNVVWTGYKPKEMNEKMYGILFKDKRNKIIETLADDIHLYSYPDKYAVLDLKNSRVVYLVQYVKKRLFGKMGITQVQVWRNKLVGLTKGLAERLFFTYLLPMADCVVTDRHQTIYGRSFWELRIVEAFERGLPVYLLDQNEHTQALLASVEDFDRLADTWWGDDPKFQGRKIAICHKKIW